MFAPPSKNQKSSAADQQTAESKANDTSEYNPVWQSLATGLQAKLTVSQPGDPYEVEADRVADRVMRMPAPPSHATELSFSSFNPGTLQRKCTSCEEEEEKNVQRKQSGAGSVAPSVNHTLASAGRPLDTSSRAFFEPRFGRDFSNVRIHTDTTAAASARSVSALAYTVGHNIVFGAGQYSPSTGTGQRLLAHELSHVCQQTSGLIMRAPDPDALAKFNSRATALKNHKVYKRLDFNARRELEEILNEARKRDNALDLMTKLEEMFDTPEKDPEKQAKEASEETEKAAERETARQKKSEGKSSRVGAEEAITNDPKRVFKDAKGLNGKTFKIDARDPTDIAIYVKVQLVRKGPRTEEQEVVRVKSLQDAIEKRIATIGYSVDLDFVDKPGDDVFTVDVNTNSWVFATNWIGDDVGLAHELHHLLGLKEDRYDYIEAHTKNEGMKFPDRIHWFHKELSKVIDNNPKSIMNMGYFLPLDDDICMVAGFRTQADIKTCVEKRTAARRKRIAPALVRAFNLAEKANAVLGNLLQGSRYDNPDKGEPTIGELRQRLALSRAETIFGKPITLDRALQIVGALRGELMMDNLFLVAELTKGCDVSHAISWGVAPRILVCPSFFRVSVEEQARTLLLESVRRAGVGQKGLGAECATAGCDEECGDETQPQAWVRFVECLEDV